MPAACPIMEWSGPAPAPTAVEAGISPGGIDHHFFRCCNAHSTSDMGHSRPIHSVPVPINVRCYSNSDMIVRRSEVTLRGTMRHMQCSDRTHSMGLDSTAAACPSTRSETKQTFGIAIANFLARLRTYIKRLQYRYPVAYPARSILWIEWAVRCE
jgi:hypothetical protein